MEITEEEWNTKHDYNDMKLLISCNAAQQFSNSLQTLAKPTGVIKHKYPQTYDMSLTRLRMSNTNKAREPGNQISEQNKRMRNKMYFMVR